jgi:hypothetical protein
MTSFDPTLADAILDRLVNNAHRLILKGESTRKIAAHCDDLTPPPEADPRRRRHSGRLRNPRPTSLGTGGRLPRNTQLLKAGVGNRFTAS